MTYGHLQADCLCTPGSAPGPTLGIESGKPLTFFMSLYELFERPSYVRVDIVAVPLHDVIAVRSRY